MLEILNETPQPFPLERLQRVGTALLNEAGVEQTVTLVLCDDASIRARNARDRGEDEATDVLSYSFTEPGDGSMPWTEHLGDVFVSVETAFRQAPAHGHAGLEEIVVLFAHGLTHLRGFDHETEAAWHPFRRAQSRALELWRATQHGAKTPQPTRGR